MHLLLRAVGQSSIVSMTNRTYYLASRLHAAAPHRNGRKDTRRANYGASIRQITCQKRYQMFEIGHFDPFSNIPCSDSLRLTRSAKAKFKYTNLQGTKKIQRETGTVALMTSARHTTVSVMSWKKNYPDRLTRKGKMHVAGRPSSEDSRAAIDTEAGVD
jgi:hypothetical protein